VEEKLRVLEVVNDFVIEIQQARRFEKNFFLYGTNLSDALENVYKARDVFDRNAAELAPILKRAGKGTVPLDIDLYESLLKRLVELEQDPTKNQKYLKDVKEIELALRQHGQKMVSFAQDLMNREKESVSQSP
jgi:two-component system NtrC family sensor kinase